jgi:hypothetical protein
MHLYVPLSFLVGPMKPYDMNESYMIMNQIHTNAMNILQMHCGVLSSMQKRRHSLVAVLDNFSSSGIILSFPSKFLSLLIIIKIHVYPPQNKGLMSDSRLVLLL